MAEPEGHPSRFGRYEVEGVLGKGAMGVVYLAKDPVIDRKVAVKVLHSQSGLDPKEMESRRGRFEREIRSAGTLSHPNIVTVFDVGQEGDHPFLAMEYIRGESLEAVMQSGRALNFQEIADIAAKTGSALDYAHERSIVHRDIKPGNILLTPDGEPKVTDFGVAKLTNMDLTSTGMIIGTPMYMAPEQITGQQIGPATDQWALAVVLFEMLTGERPFEGDNPTTVMYRVVHEDPQPPRSVNTALPRAIDNVILRALSKKPQNRFPSCIAFAKALRAALQAVLQDITDDDVPLQDLSEGSTAIFDRVDIEVDSPVQVRPQERSRDRGEARRRGRGGIWAIVAAGVVVVGAGAWANMSGFIGGPSKWSGNLEVVSTPAGAEIWVGGVDSQLVTPAFVPLTGVEGDVVDLELRRGDGSLAATQLVLGPTVPPRWETEVAPPPERLVIASAPEGAVVSIDGTAAGAAPVEVALEPGVSYALSVTLDGYEAVERTISLEEIPADARRAGRLAFDLAKIVPPGFVQVRADYPVTVEAAGRRQSGPRAALPPGRHDLVISAPDVFFQTRRSVEIRSGESVEISLPQAVEITVAATPSNCQVSVDGRDVGFVPSQIRITVGPHTFGFRWQGIDGEVRVTEQIGPATRRVFQAAPAS